MLSTFIFFFKQKTAYEMRISDWSSDVCSSDLTRHDDADANAVSADFLAHAVAHRIERVLARGVSTESRPRLGRSQRRDVDDVAAALRLHRPDCRAAGVQRRHQVDVEHAAIFRGVDVLVAAGRNEAGGMVQ